MALAGDRDLAIALIRRDLAAVDALDAVSDISPDGDEGKFTFLGERARVVQPRDGYYLNVNLGWFRGEDRPAQISRGPIAWYVFIVPKPVPRYAICDWKQMRRWVLSFEAPLGRDFRDKLRWRADLHPIANANAALFRWGDETQAGAFGRGNRILDLDNAAKLILASVPRASRGAAHGPGGESGAHRLLKLYVAANPGVVGASATAKAIVEHRFTTGDRVDVMFENHDPDRRVVEIEVDGEDNLVIGVAQAVKYAALASFEGRYPLVSPRVQSAVVAYETEYARVRELAERYDVRLVTVPQELVLRARLI